MKASNLSILIFVLTLIVERGQALLCYRCDALHQPKSDCPGWHRRPIDSLRDLGDRGGLYTHCVDIRLANGTVLYQVNSQTNRWCCYGSTPAHLHAGPTKPTLTKGVLPANYLSVFLNTYCKLLFRICTPRARPA